MFVTIPLPPSSPQESPNPRPTSRFPIRFFRMFPRILDQRCDWHIVQADDARPSYELVHYVESDVDDRRGVCGDEPLCFEVFARVDEY